MILPPLAADGPGIAILNSNAETHFSFTNALGMVSVEQTRRLQAAIAQFPRAQWIIAMHHHLVEYPMSVAAFSERIGTALINGSWFIRKLRSVAPRAIIMHGHRHIDWIGTCGKLKIISAPSPVMGAKDEAASYFQIHTLTAGPDGEVGLLPPGTRRRRRRERRRLNSATTLPVQPRFADHRQSATSSLKLDKTLILQTPEPDAPGRNSQMKEFIFLVLFVALGQGAAVAKSITATGASALALAAVVADHSTLVSAYHKRVLARLLSATPTSASHRTERSR